MKHSISANFFAIFHPVGILLCLDFNKLPSRYFRDYFLYQVGSTHRNKKITTDYSGLDTVHVYLFFIEFSKVV